MPEVQILSDPYWVRWIIAGLVGAVSALMIYIWRSMKKDIDDIKILQRKDHDRVDIIETKVNIYHPESRP